MIYIKRKISKGQTPKDRLEWKQASEYWTKESPVARGNNFNKTVREADIYDYHEIFLENGKRLDSYDPDAGEIISRKATDLDKISEETYGLLLFLGGSVDEMLDCIVGECRKPIEIE